MKTKYQVVELKSEGASKILHSTNYDAPEGMSYIEWIEKVAENYSGVITFTFSDVSFDVNLDKDIYKIKSTSIISTDIPEAITELEDRDINDPEFSLMLSYLEYRYNVGHADMIEAIASHIVNTDTDYVFYHPF